MPAPLTGRLVSPAVAQRHPVAVMIDDHHDARPQSGFNDAAIVWQAPAEGGIPRYMLIFQDRIPPSVGPVRSARQYYIAWAAEWKAVYAHVGGSPQAMQTLREKGRGQLVYNADEFRWGGIYFHRTRDRFAPHNVYTSGKELYQLSRRVGAKNEPIKAAWRFAPDKHPLLRPEGTRITVVYSQNTITYRYDRASNTYRRAVSGEKRQIDRGVDKPVAPKNVIVMTMSFGRLNDGSQEEPPRGPVHRARRGLDLDERDDDQGHVAQALDHRSDPLLRCGRQAGHADRRADVHPGHAEGLEDHDQGRQGPEVHPDVPAGARRGALTRSANASSGRPDRPAGQPRRPTSA